MFQILPKALCLARAHTGTRRASRYNSVLLLEHCFDSDGCTAQNTRTVRHFDTAITVQLEGTLC